MDNGGLPILIDLNTPHQTRLKTRNKPSLMACKLSNDTFIVEDKWARAWASVSNCNNMIIFEKPIQIQSGSDLYPHRMCTELFQNIQMMDAVLMLGILL